MDDERKEYKLSDIELDLMSTGSQPVTEHIRTWGYSVTMTVRMHVRLFSNPVDTINNDHLGGDHDIDEALARTAQRKLNDITGNNWKDEIEVLRIESREVND